MSPARRPARRPPRKLPRLAHDLDRPDADPEEVLDIHTISDDSSENMPSRVRNGRASPSKPSPTAKSKSRGARPSVAQDVIEILSNASTDNTHDDVDMSDFEDVDVANAGPATGASREASEDLEMEDVDLDPDNSTKDLHDMYADAYREVQAKYGDGAIGEDGQDGSDQEQTGDDSTTDPKAIPIFKDGKGQHRGVEISVGSRTPKQSGSTKPKSTSLLTPRDRQNRITAHKLLVLAMLAHARVRNKWCNDDDLRDTLADSVPDYLITKLRSIHPKKVPEQRERIRMFESFLSELVRWWTARFRLDPTMVAASALRQPDQDIATGIMPSSGRRIDGWVVETAAEREQRHRRERREQQRYRDAKEQQANAKSKGKGKAKAASATSALLPPTKAMEITIFAPGSAIRPIYLRLLSASETISSPAELKQRALDKAGSRETSAQLFCALCRSLGIPARLVVSPQPMPWSVGASKLANSAAGTPADKKPNQLRAKATTPASRRFASKPVHELTSDDESVASSGSAKRTANRGKAVPHPMGFSSADEASDAKRGTPAKARAATSRREAPGSASTRTSRQGNREQPILLDGTASDASSKSAAATPKKGKASTRAAAVSESARRKGKAREVDPPVADDDGSEDDDYRPEKWKNLKTPLEVEHKVKLRAFRPKQLKDSELAGEDTTADPVDLQAPPTMWVEVFSKPYQKWISVDPVRSLVRPSGNRHMEPAPFDRQNKLIYVAAFEEDGYARDVTARYTKTLNSRVSRLRPPTRAKGEEDWWTRVVRAMHRPQELDRDAMEDAELQDFSAREPMPSSMAGFKDHPVYFLEKFLKRDEVVFPRRQIATFQGTPVFSKSDVVTLRSSRQWYNEGRVVKDGETALKFVKARGYTLANKRAEEQAKLEGREVAQEGLYAEFQTQLYVPPAVGPDGVIPTNGFGNIDLFVPSMLPAGAVHLPMQGTAKVAKKIGVPYAEAITGFEFRKQRGMPKITGIVVAAANAEMVEDAFWQQEQQDALRQQTKKMERAMKNWRKLVNAVRIAKRVQEQYKDSIEGQPQDAPPNEDQEKEDGEKSRFFAPKSAEALHSADTDVGEKLDVDVEMADGVETEPAASAVSTPRRIGAIISLAQLAAAPAEEGPEEEKEKEEEVAVGEKRARPERRSTRARKGQAQYDEREDSDEAPPEQAETPRRTRRITIKRPRRS